MVYMVGKANESLNHLKYHVVSTIEPFTSNSSELANNTVTQAWQIDVERQLSSLTSQSSELIDPYLLRNEVATVDESNQAERTQYKAKQIVFQQLKIQFPLWFITPLLIHFGIPLSLSVPSIILASGISFAWMNLKWEFAKQSFLKNIGASNKLLENRLLQAYETEFSRAIASPLALAIKSIDENTKSTKAKLGEANKLIESYTARILKKSKE